MATTPLTPTLSVQLYTVRDQLAADLDGTLARLAAMGLTNVEAFDFVSRAPELAESFRANGLVARTGHATMLSDEIRVGDDVFPVASQDEVFTAAKTLGLEIVIDAFVAPERWLDEDAVADTAARLNRAAERAADHGLRVGYHNHTQEFAASFGGRSAFEVFADQLDESVALEVDLFWAATAKQDVVGLLGRLGERVQALHVKDGIIGPDPFVGETGPHDAQDLDQRPAGQGEVPLLDYLAAAPSARFAIIEFDTYPGDIFAAVKESVDFLAARGIR